MPPKFAFGVCSHKNSEYFFQIPKYPQVLLSGKSVSPLGVRVWRIYSKQQMIEMKTRSHGLPLLFPASSVRLFHSCVSFLFVCVF